MSRKIDKDWISLGFPKAMYERVRKVIVFTGHPSVPEYVREKVSRHLDVDEEKKDIAESNFENLGLDIGEG